MTMPGLASILFQVVWLILPLSLAEQVHINIHKVSCDVIFIVNCATTTSHFQYEASTVSMRAVNGADGIRDSQRNRLKHLC